MSRIEVRPCSSATRRLLSLGLLVVVGTAGAIEQSASYEQGVPLLVSWGDRVDVGLMPIKHDGIGRRRHAFLLRIANRTERQFDVSTDHVSAIAAGQPAAVVPAETLVRDIRRRGAWERFGMGLAGGLNAGTAASSAGRYSESGRFRGQIHDSRSSATFTGDYNSHGYDGAAAEQARQREMDRTANVLAGMRSAQSARLTSIQDSLLMRTTVDSGDDLVRMIVIEPTQRLRAGARVSVRVDLSGESHDLRLQRTESGWLAEPLSVAAVDASQPLAIAPTSVPLGRLVPESTSVRSSTAGLVDSVVPDQDGLSVDHEFHITPYLQSFRVEPGTSSVGAAVHNVLFDAQWIIFASGTRLPRRVIGDLVFADDTGPRVRIPWPLPSDGGSIPHWRFAEPASGFVLENEKSVEAWMTSTKEINEVVRYEIERVEW